MNNHTTLLWAMLVCICIILPAGGIPTTGSATVNETCVTMSGTAGDNATFVYGHNTNIGFSSATPNKTAGGAYTEIRCDDPIFQPGQTYKFKACDTTGCGATATFTMASLIPSPTTNFSVQGMAFITNGGDPNWVLLHIWDVYAVVWGSYFLLLLIGMIFINITIKQKTIAVSLLLALLSGAALWALAPELQQIAAPLIILGMAGMMFWVWKRKR